MIDTHWLTPTQKVEVNFNELTSCFFALTDVKNALTREILKLQINPDFDEETIGSSLDEVIGFLETLEQQYTEVKP
jgi:hypothetical protein